MAPTCLCPGCVSDLAYEENQIPLTLHQMSLISEQLGASSPLRRDGLGGFPAGGHGHDGGGHQGEAVVLTVETQAAKITLPKGSRACPKHTAGKESARLRAVEKHGLGRASHPGDPLLQGL